MNILKLEFESETLDFLNNKTSYYNYQKSLFFSLFNINEKLNNDVR